MMGTHKQNVKCLEFSIWDITVEQFQTHALKKVVAAVFGKILDTSIQVSNEAQT
jgi:hypothetical protein